MEKAERIRVVLVEPHKKATATVIDHTLQDLQKIVEGYIECVYPFDDNACIICNEEGKINGLEPNRALTDEEGNVVDVVFGTFIVAGLTEESFGSLTEKQAEKYYELYKYPEVFISTDKGLVTFKIED